MSTVNVQPTTSARAAVTYALLGTGKRRAQNLKDGTTRAAVLSCSLDSPEEIVRRAEQVSAAFHRRNEMYTYTQNFSPEEFDVNNPGHVARVHDLGVKLARRMNSADYLVVTHTDSSGGHLHNHIYVVNHDNLTGKALSRCRSWSRGLRQVNDELMRDEHCQVLPDPQQPKPDWDLRRGGFAEGGFEQVLGDKITEALLDPRSTDREAFEQVLAEHEVRLRVTERDGWTYSMRRADNGKWGRRKASSLCDEFMSSRVEEIFVFHQQNTTTKEEQDERSGKAQGTAAGLGDISSLDVEARRRRGTDKAVDERREQGERLPQGNGRGAERRVEAVEQVDLAAARAALANAARRRDEEQTQRDREDTRRSRQAAEHFRRSEAARREHRETVRSRLVLNDADPQVAAGDDDYSLE